MIVFGIKFLFLLPIFSLTPFLILKGLKIAFFVNLTHFSALLKVLRHFSPFKPKNWFLTLRFHFSRLKFLIKSHFSSFKTRLELFILILTRLIWKARADFKFNQLRAAKNCFPQWILLFDGSKSKSTSETPRNLQNTNSSSQWVLPHKSRLLSAIKLFSHPTQILSDSEQPAPSATSNSLLKTNESTSKTSSTKTLSTPYAR